MLITTSELGVGQNRFAFGLLKEHQLLEDAQAVVRHAAEGQQGRLQTGSRHPMQGWRSSSRATVCTSIQTGHGMCTLKGRYARYLRGPGTL